VYSGSFAYNFILLPLVCFGGFSVMLAFVVLLPGVGNFLAAVWTFMVGDFLYRKRTGDSQIAESDDQVR
jgi:uncharacterized protein involved in cysteine biosynthesis